MLADATMRRIQMPVQARPVPTLPAAKTRAHPRCSPEAVMRVSGGEIARRLLPRPPSTAGYQHDERYARCA